MDEAVPTPSPRAVAGCLCCRGGFVVLNVLFAIPLFSDPLIPRITTTDCIQNSFALNAQIVFSGCHTTLWTHKELARQASIKAPAETHWRFYYSLTAKNASGLQRPQLSRSLPRSASLQSTHPKKESVWGTWVKTYKVDGLWQGAFLLLWMRHSGFFLSVLWLISICRKSTKSVQKHDSSHVTHKRSVQLTGLENTGLDFSHRTFNRTMKF